MSGKIIPNFDMNKLPEYVDSLLDNKVMIIGVGAVGSYVAEILTKVCVVKLILVDMDDFETANIAKSSSAYIVDEDNGCNKAIALAKRLNHMLGDEFVHGINSDITNFGPGAFAYFDVIILALDNYAAKIYSNQVWRQIPEDKRPLMIFGGTVGSSAHSNCIDGRESCLRCMLDEKWLENSMEKSSCTGINYRSKYAVSEFSRTTGGASRIAADLMEEQCAGYLLGYKDMINKRYMFNSYPNFGFMKATPIRKKNCPDCRDYLPIDNAEALEDMDVLHTTVGEMLAVVRSKMPDDSFEILASAVEFGNITYSNIIVNDHCRSCGRELKNLYRHEFRTRYTDMLCAECKASGKEASPVTTNDIPAECIKAVTVDNCDAVLSAKTLYDIGFSLGSFIKVKHKSGGKSFLDCKITYHIYYLENDQKLLNVITELEG